MYYVKYELAKITSMDCLCYSMIGLSVLIIFKGFRLSILSLRIWCVTHLWGKILMHHKMSTAWYLLFTTHQDHFNILCSNMLFKMNLLHSSFDHIKPLFPNFPSHSVVFKVIFKLSLSMSGLVTDKFEGTLDAKHCEHLLGVKWERW